MDSFQWGHTYAVQETGPGIVVLLVFKWIGKSPPMMISPGEYACRETFSPEHRQNMLIVKNNLNQNIVDTQAQNTCVHWFLSQPYEPILEQHLNNFLLGGSQTGSFALSDTFNNVMQSTHTLHISNELDWHENNMVIWTVHRGWFIPHVSVWT